MCVVRTTIDLPEELLRAAKARAAADGETLKEFFTRIVAQALETSPGPRPQRSRVSLPLVGGGPPRVEVTNDAIAGLLADEDVERYGEQ